MSETNSAKYMRGIAALKFKGSTLGYVKKGSFKLNGAKAEYTPIEAEQVPDGPVDIIITKGATIKPTFSLIELEYERLQVILGGELVKDKTNQEKIIGWDAPVDMEAVIGDFELEFYSGRVLPMPRALLLAAVDGDVSYSTPVELTCEIVPIKDLADDKKSLYGIHDKAEEAKG